MKALVYSKGKIKLQEKEKPSVKSPKDAIIRVTMSSICTSDLHIIEGFVGRANDNIVLGHEFVGIVEETGVDVKNFKKGDRVAVNCETFCGECYFCKNGFINNCTEGGWELGCRIDGCQAEFVRIPFADSGLNKLPDDVSDKEALFVGDILSSGYFGALMCEIKENDSIAVIGTGPVGMCAMISAKLKGAKTIIAIDKNEDRLNIAKENELANYFLNPKKININEEIKKITKYGADNTIEAAGGNDTFKMAYEITRPNGIIGVVAMYEKDQILPLPSMYGKNLTFKTGGVDAIHCKELISLIQQKKINTDFLITHTFKLDEIEKAYEIFKDKNSKCLKIAIVN